MFPTSAILSFVVRWLIVFIPVDDGSQVQNVFYNPIQQFNRDLSVLAIKAFAEDMCQRKRQRHEVQREKAQKKKKNNKRKRDEAREEHEDVEESGAKLRKARDGSPRVPESVESATDAAQQSIGDGKHNGADLYTNFDGGVAVVKGQEINDTSAYTTVEPAKAGDHSNPTDGNKSNHAKVDDQGETQQEWRSRFRILDALSATGLRALRYASEIQLATAVVANDRDPHAVRGINLNLQHNRLTSSVTTTTGDAQGHMYSVAFPPPQTHGPQHISGKYDVIDLDPYGTAAPFIDASLQALEDGGLLCVTYTDSGVWASHGYSEKTFALYGGLPIKGNHSHEGGLRLILLSIATSASKYGIAIEPLLSLSIDFYARLFIRVRKSARDAKFLAGKTMLVYNCDHGCGALSTQFLGRHTRQPSNGKEVNWKYSIAQAPSVDRFCEHCGSKMHVAGPMWGGPLHNPAFIEKVLDDVENIDEEVHQTKQRVEGVLNTALDELAVNSDTMDYRPTPSETTSEKPEELIPQTPPEALDHHPFFFIPSALCKVIKAVAPPENLVKGALRHAGYRATRSHCKGGSIKTDAPWSFIWEIMREWVRQKSPIKEGAVKEGSAGWKILQCMRKAEEDDGENDVAGNGTAEGSTAKMNGSDGDKLNGETKRLTVVFDEQLGRDKPGKRLVRYQMNPRENWGPMTKAKGRG